MHNSFASVLFGGKGIEDSISEGDFELESRIASQLVHRSDRTKVTIRLGSMSHLGETGFLRNGGKPLRIAAIHSLASISSDD